MNDSQYPDYKTIQHTGVLEAPFYHKDEISVELTHVFLWTDKQIWLFLLLTVRFTYQYLQNHLLKKYHKIYVRKEMM